MSVNRLADLQKEQRRQDGQGNAGNGGYEMRPLLSTGGGGDISTVQGFLEQVSHIRENISKINDNISRMQTYQSSMLQTADANELDRIRSDLDNLTKDTQMTMTHVKQKLKEIEPNSRQKDLEMRKNAFITVTKTFMETIDKHRRTALEFQKAEGQQMERQIKIANPNATPQEIQQAVSDAEQGGGAVFAQQLMQAVKGDYRRQGAQNTLDAVQERHQDIARLAKSVQELSVLFEEMHDMLEAQKRVLDTVEQNAEQVVYDLETGVGSIEKAKVSAKATRRKKWICFAIFIIILIIIAIVLGVKFGGGSNNDPAPAPAPAA
ncbi:t-SNARE [Pilaira anomala]|nr:t-SNARE [Pilaira anomala]